MNLSKKGERFISSLYGLCEVVRDGYPDPWNMECVVIESGELINIIFAGNDILSVFDTPTIEQRYMEGFL